MGSYQPTKGVTMLFIIFFLGVSIRGLQKIVFLFHFLVWFLQGISVKGYKYLAIQACIQSNTQCIVSNTTYYHNLKNVIKIRH